ncbi:FMRFamide-activated amiloride-sensitive sodium channel [Trichonephila inaurata madagascariensis]|uniref:FMRFamide-activated amiloride-sensitive sodium channel n=1 Tax=Trichonephila inaurata madagascariensis TaxID=2747483 RepID=A0A8X6WLA0_9ARAC|nr:FMRFamide-activated amiloride-sensitive sodium channel [Trichonephila inaurata madagascariensis]
MYDNSTQKGSKKHRRIFVLDEDGNKGDSETSYAQDKSHTNSNNYNNIYSSYDMDEGIADMNAKTSGDDVILRKRVTNLNRNENGDEERQPLNYSELTSSFFKKSSIYALNQIGNSNTTRRKVFWAFILIGGLVGCCSQVYRYLSAYYEYPVVINIDSKNLFRQKFPGVTVCNLNNIRRDYYDCVLRKLDRDSCSSSTVPVPESLREAVTWDTPFCFEENDDTTLSEEFLERIQFQSLYLSLDNTSRFHYGHQSEDFIISCSFNGEECSHSDFSLYLDDMYGNCFTFNKANSSKPPLKTSFVGPNSGLMLELDVKSDEYIWLTKSVGARVVIHDPYQKPTPQDQGINVSPGFETTLGLSKVVMKRLPYPYKDNCKDYEKGDSKRQCDSVCSQKKISKFCNCSIPYGILETDRFCNYDNVTELCCVYQGQKDYGVDITCKCPLECESVSFDLKISSGVWPAKVENLDSVYRKQTIEAVRENMIKVRIYFDTLEQLTYEQKAMFEDSEVLSQVGGQMGLWLGLSLAAMFECLENIVLLWHYRKQHSRENIER